MSIRGSSIDLGGIVDAIAGGSTATPNPYFNSSVDDDGNIIDAQGNPIKDQQAAWKAFTDDNGSLVTQPFQDPTGWQKFAHPAVAQKMIDANNAPNMAQQQHDITQNLAAQDFSKVQNSMATPVSALDPTQAAIMTGGKVDTSTLNTVQNNALQNFYGLPQATTSGTTIRQGIVNRQNSTYANTHGPEDVGMANAYQDYNTLTGAQRRTAIGSAITDADASKAAADYSLSNSRAALSNLPARTSLEAQQLGGQLASIGDENAARGNEAYTRSLLAGARAGAANTMADTERNAIRNEAYAASHPAVASSPFYRSPSGAPAIDPSFVNSMTALPAKLGAAGTGASGQKAVPLGNG